MCGIIGIIREGNLTLLPELRNSLNIIKYRGPDDDGVWCDSVIINDSTFSLGLGHVRLSILDLSSKGHQPMISSFGHVIVHNGEIYNYLEIKQELIALGYEFKSDTDTEVILYAYKEWGESCVDHFIGMWAFVIWDGNRLFISRDRLGQKPLYYFQNPSRGLFAFASEIKAMWAINDVRWVPDETTVFRFLAYGEMEKDGNTFFDQIKEFPAACYAFYKPGDIDIKTKRYWSLEDNIIDISEKEATERASELFKDSINLQLRSDVPVGVSLSGGLDSTLILSMINELGIKNVPVFSTRYNEHGYDETHYTDIAIKNLDCNPYGITADVTHFKKVFEKIIYHLDQPSKLAGPYSQWKVAELASKNVKVLLDGQGPDEIAGGYMYFLPAAWLQESLSRKILYAPDLLHTVIANRHVLNQYPLAVIINRLLKNSDLSNMQPLNKAWSAQFKDIIPGWNKSDSIIEILNESVTSSSLPALLRYGDRDNMAFGLENRSPFLDHRLIEFVSSLPAHMKIRGGTTKWIFRAVAKKRVPKEILKRRLKMGFPTPFGEWVGQYLSQDIKQWLKSYKAIPFFQTCIDHNRFDQILEEHISRKSDHHALIWRVLSFGACLKTFEIH